MSTTDKKSIDPLQVAANVYSLVMENDYVRVLDARFGRGAKAIMHYHPNHVIYVLTGGKIKITTPDITNSNVDLKAGQAIWMQAGQNAAENIGKTKAHNLVVELKK